MVLLISAYFLIKKAYDIKGWFMDFLDLIIISLHRSKIFLIWKMLNAIFWK